MSSKKRLNINDLRVIDLRVELEKRNLDKSGVRGVLIERLWKYLEEEGHDPEKYNFELADSKTPTKRTRRAESAIEQEAEETPAMEDMIVQDDAGDEEETEVPGTEENAKQASETMEVDENEKTSRKRELKEDSEASQAKKACLEKEKEDEHKNENNTDAEDSINLDIGDDELLNEETDNTTKPDNKDEAGDEEEEETAEPPTDEQAAAAAAAPDDQLAGEEAAATSNDTEKSDKDQKDEKEKDGDSEKKEKKDESKEGGARNLWVSGLSGDTRAKDLKQLCSKHGKVIGAKVVTNARTPGSRCYGYVTMASAQDAENCIKNLHRTELHGRMISVEKAKSESESASRRQPSRSERRSSKDAKDDTKDKDGKESDKSEVKVKKEGEESGAESNRSTSRTREKSTRSDKDRARRSTRSRERRRSPREVLSFNKIWKERDVARARERSRAAREEERRRRAAEEALRDRERRMRQEKQRLAFERDELRAEREKIEREKNELLRLERERHRLEREKLELERLELKRAQLRLEEERRKRGYENSTYRKAASPPPDPAYERDSRHKRPPPPIASSRTQFEAPPPPRFEIAANYERGADKRADRERDYKRDYPPRHASSSNLKYSSNGGATDDTRQPMPPGTRPKEPGIPNPMTVLSSGLENWGWSDTLEDLRHEMRRLHNRACNTKRDEDWQKYKAAMKEYKKQVRRKNRQKLAKAYHSYSNEAKNRVDGKKQVETDELVRAQPPTSHDNGQAVADQKVATAASADPRRSYESRDTRSYRASPPSKPEPRWAASSRYPDSAAPAKSSGGGGGGGSGEAWSGAGEARYAGYEARYPPQYQPPPPGAPYPDRYAGQARDYARKY